MELQTTRPDFLNYQAHLHFTHLSEITDHFIKQITKGVILTQKGVRYSESTIRAYKMFSTHLTNYETLLKYKFEIAELNIRFANHFKRYLISQNLTKNSIALVLSKFKAVMQYAVAEGYALWGGCGVKTQNERSTKVFLTISEISKLQQITNSETHQRVVDIFTIQCFTGLRYDTLRKFLTNPLSYIHEHEGFSYIDITSDKTGEQSVIPLGEIVVDILKKYNGNLKPFSERYINKEIKVIAKKAGLTNEVPIRITIGSELQENLLPKYSQISTHTARRSFSTNILKFIKDKEAVAAMTGHSSIQQLDHYNRSEKIDRVIPYIDHDFFSSIKLNNCKSVFKKYKTMNTENQEPAVFYTRC